MKDMKTPIGIGILFLAGLGLFAQTASTTKNIDLSQGSALLVSYCSPCHDWAADYDSIMASGVIAKGDSASSPAWQLISSGQMPMSGPAPSAAEQQLIRDWIDAGAPPPKK